MGYEIERFVDAKSADKFKCGICSKVIENPVMIIVCDHLYCRQCLYAWLTNDTSCPEDGKPVAESDLVKPSRSIRNPYDELEIRCDFATVGCREVVPLASLADHLDACNFNKLDCVKSCGFNGTKRQMENHDCMAYLKELVASLTTNLELVTSSPTLNIEGMSRFEKMSIIFKLLESDPVLKQMFRDDKSGNSDDSDTSKKRRLMPAKSPSDADKTMAFANEMRGCAGKDRKFGSYPSTSTDHQESEVLKSDLEKSEIQKLNSLAQIIYKKLRAEDTGENGIRKAIAENQALIERIEEICLSRDIQFFDAKNSVFEEVKKIQPILDEKYGAAQLNCKKIPWPFWHLVSVSLFGVFRACKALGLLTTATLIKYKNEFVKLIEKDLTKSFENLVNCCIRLDGSHSEYIAVAISLAIRRPFYFYSNFYEFNAKISSKKAMPMSLLYDEAKRVYEQNDFSHFRIVGFEEDDNNFKKPICLFTVGYFQYVILPKDANNGVLPWKPKKLFQDNYLVSKNVTNK